MDTIAFPAGQLANLQLPQNLAKRAQDLNLGLVPPQPGQIIWLPEPAAAGEAPAISSTPRTPLLVIQQPGGRESSQTPR